jgi:hypothetical protein
MAVMSILDMRYLFFRVSWLRILDILIRRKPVEMRHN